MRNGRLLLLWLLPVLLCCTTLSPLMLSSQAQALPAGATPAAANLYADYRDIPGVTAEEIAAIERIKAASSSLELASLLSTEAFTEDGGSVQGYLALLCTQFSDLFGVPFVPKIYTQTGDDAEAVPTHDFVYNLSPSLALRNVLHQTGPVIRRTVNIYRLRDAVPVESIARRRLPRYGFLRSDTIARNVETLSPMPFEAVLAADYDALVQLLYDESIDAFFVQSAMETAFEKYPAIVSDRFLPLIYQPTCLYTGKPELAPFVSVMEKYLGNGGREELVALYDSGTHQYRLHKFFSQLTASEKDYVNTHINTGAPIYFAASFDDYPTCFYNKEAQEYQGIAIDILAEISALTGLVFEPYNQVGDDWYKLLGNLENGDVSFVVELLFTSARAKTYLWTDEPYNADNYALLSLIDTPDISISDIPDSRVGLILETAYSDIFFSWFPDHRHTVSFDNYDDAFTALEAGDVDFVMGSECLLLNISNYLERVGFKANIIFDYVSESAFGFHSSEVLLRSVISKAQGLVDVQDISSRWGLRTFDYRQKLTKAQFPYLVGAGVLSVIVIALLITLFFINKNINKQLETTVRQRTAELERQTEAAKVASMAKSAFLGRMSHELRTPLNAVLGMAQVARQNMDKSDRAQQPLSEISTASNHLLQLLNDVLDMSQIDAGRLELSFDAFPLKPALSDLKTHAAHLCADKGLTFICNTDDLPTLTVTGDQVRLKQILLNLLSNAVKFTPAGGTVRFLADCQITKETATLSFRVADNGIGIPEEQMANLFQAFEQANSSIATHFGGMGLGLSIAQELVRKMGGQIAVESAVGVGTAFSFAISLPIQPEAPAAIAPEDYDFSGKRLLVVDDIEINRIILTELLSDTHVQIEEAANGAEALRMFAESPLSYYDLIFMDIQMPVMDGHEATRAIRLLDRADAKAVFIVAVTANSYPEDVAKAQAAGMNEHMAKPVDAEAVRLILREKLLPLIQ